MQNVPKDMRERRVLSCSSIRGDPETRQKRILRNKKETSERKKRNPRNQAEKKPQKKPKKNINTEKELCSETRQK